MIHNTVKNYNKIYIGKSILYCIVLYTCPNILSIYYWK